MLEERAPPRQYSSLHKSERGCKTSVDVHHGHHDGGSHNQHHEDGARDESVVGSDVLT